MTQEGQDGQGEEAHGRGAVSDRHMIFRFDERRRVLAVLPWLVQSLPDTVFAPEIILGKYFASTGLNVRKTSRFAFTVRTMAPGKVDATRWNAGAGDSLPCMRGLLVKYVEEHSQAVATCQADPCTCDTAADVHASCASLNESTCRSRHWARYLCANHCSVGCRWHTMQEAVRSSHGHR